MKCVKSALVGSWMMGCLMVFLFPGCNMLFLTEEAAETVLGDADGDRYPKCADEPSGQPCDCYDDDPSIHPGADEICDEVDNNCDGNIDEGFDQDNDDYYTCESGEKGKDCDDENPSANPGKVEVCDAIDNDCDGDIDEDFDQDNDGYYTCALENRAVDCDDYNPSIYPGAEEVCDEVDSNCDGNVDEDLKTTYYFDADSDRYGNNTKVQVACNQPKDYVERPGDCNDADEDIRPGADESCNATDDDCDGLTDELIVIRTRGVNPDVVYRVEGEPLFQANEDGTEGFETIQAAIDAVAEAASKTEKPAWGDNPVVLVQCEATYNENINFKRQNIYLMSQHGQVETIIDGGKVSSVVSFIGDASGLNTMDGAVLDGFTIQNGEAVVGGGIVVSRSNPTLKNLLIQDSNATAGGGIYMAVSKSSLSNVEVTRNDAIDAGAGISIQLASFDGQGPALTDVNVHDNDCGNLGAGIQISQVGAKLKNVTIEGNFGARWGGGLYAYFATLEATNLRVEDNTLKSKDGPFLGGGVYLNTSTVTLHNASVKNNGLADHGGGVYALSSTLTAYNLFVSENETSEYGGGIWSEASELTLYNALISDNNSMYDGGGISGNDCKLDGNSDPITPCITLTQSIVANNSATHAGGGLSFWQTSGALVNSIVAYNQALSAANLHHYSDEPAPSSISFEYSALYPVDTSDVTLTPTGVDFTVEPGFLSYGDDGLPTDLHLAKNSPLANEGDPTLKDPDDSRSDLGIYGGAAGKSWDLDFDGKYDYYWPGTFADVPAGVITTPYDCDDNNALYPATGACP